MSNYDPAMSTPDGREHSDPGDLIYHQPVPGLKKLGRPTQYTNRTRMDGISMEQDDLIYLDSTAGTSRANKQARMIARDRLLEAAKVKYLEPMQQARNNMDQENAHIAADTILCELLTELGFAELIAVYDDIEKWYA
jgi:hypothetical protein